MQIRNIMTPSVRTIGPSDSLRDAALIMAECDVGALPVADHDRLIGMITDRDIAVRGMALGKTGQTKVSEAMSGALKYCFDDEDVEDVCANMGDIQVRRLPVVNHNKRLVGIVSLADIATAAQCESAGMALEAITRPGGAHSQAGEASL
jgi:CBS domain-containing protein